MPTTIYYTDDLSDLTISGRVVRKASLSRGAGVVTKSMTSAGVAPVAVYDTGTTPLNFAIQVNAFSATAGTYTFNHWGSESSAMANYCAAMGPTSQNITVYDSAGTFRFSLVSDSTWRSASEYGTSPAAGTDTATGLAQTINDGDYIVFRPHHGSLGSPGTGYTLTFSYAGTSASADGDSYTTCPDTITEYAPPAAERVPLGNRQLAQLLAHCEPFRRRGRLWVPGWAA